MARRPLLIAVTAAAVLIAALPIILTVALGWYHTSFLEGMLGKGAGIYVLLVLVYLVWLPATVFGLVFVYDRLGLHYEATERPPKRPRRRERARRRATARAIAAEQSALAAAKRASRERERSRVARRPASRADSGTTGRASETTGRGSDTPPRPPAGAPGETPPAPSPPARSPASGSEAGDDRRRPKAG